jgi:hypothetical protein
MIGKSELIITRILFVIAVLFFLSSCKFNSNYQKSGESSLQGTWIQESVPYQDDLLTYSLHEFRFSCDSVYVKISSFAKQPIIVDSCYNNGAWTEFAKGLYVIRNDSLLIEATYVYENGKQKLKGCYHIGQYLPRLQIKKQSADSLYLEAKNSHIPINLRKTETTNCVPKIVY